MSNHSEPEIEPILERLGHAWRDEIRLLDRAFDLAGGMTFQKVKGIEYLVRYRQDSFTGKKKMTSLGRRSADTERQIEAFIADRDANRRSLAEARASIDRDCRLARAMKFARVPAKLAEQARSIDVAGFQGVALAGPAAVYAYEAAWARRMPGHAIAPGTPIESIYVIEASFGDDDLEMALIACGMDPAAAQRHADGNRVSFTDDDGRSVTFVERPAGYDPDSDVVAMAVSKDAKPAPIRAVSPELWFRIDADDPAIDPLSTARRRFVEDLQPHAVRAGSSRAVA